MSKVRPADAGWYVDLHLESVSVACLWGWTYVFTDTEHSLTW